MDATTPVTPPAPQPEGVLSSDGKLRLYGYKNPPPQPLAPPKMVELKPMVMTLSPGRYSWCSCGYSVRQPFCDDSHRKEEHATNRRSYKFEVLEEAQVAFCMCKHTGNPPYCDHTCQTIREMAQATAATPPVAAPAAATAEPAVVPPLAAATPVAKAPSLKDAQATLPRETVKARPVLGVQLGALASFILFVGRIALSYIFLRSGFNHLTDLAHTAENIGRNMPFIPETLQGATALIAGVMLLFGGLMVLLGIGTQLGAFMLVLFLVPTLLFFHNFWDTTKFADEVAVRMQTISWQKNLAMLGGLLILLATGPGSISVDRMFRQK